MSASILPAIPTYLSVSSNEAARVTQFEKTDAQTKSDIAYFTKQAPKLTTVAALLKDYRSLSIVLNAYGMSANVQQTALLRQLMTQDPTSTSSVAQKIANPTYMRFAKAMAQFIPPPFATAAGVATVVNATGTGNFENAQDAQSPGVGLALYFKRSIGGLTSLAQLMSDPNMLTVATTSTNMPDSFSSMDYTKQVQLLSAKIDMTKFQNPTYVDKFVEKYLAINTANTQAAVDTTGALAILNGTGNSDTVLGALMPVTASSTGTASILSLFA